MLLSFGFYFNFWERSLFEGRGKRGMRLFKVAFTEEDFGGRIGFFLKKRRVLMQMKNNDLSLVVQTNSFFDGVVGPFVFCNLFVTLYASFFWVAYISYIEECR